MIRINKNLVLFSGLFLLLSTIVLFIIHKFSPLIGHVAYYCQSFINTHMIPIPYYLSLIPFVSIFLVLGISFIKFLVLIIKAQFLKHKLRGNRALQNTVSSLTKNLGLENMVILVNSNEKFAFCLGVRSPKIYISTGLIAKLSEKEIEAVLRHEQYHLENHDTFIMIIASAVRAMFPFFPVLGDLIKKYRIEREIKADKFAIERVGEHYSLISALKKLLAFPTVATIPAASIADQDTLEPRIYSLLDKHYTYSQFKIKHILITLFSAFIIGAIIITPVHAKEIHHDKHDVMMLCTAEEECMNSCMSKKNMIKLYSEISATKNVHIENASIFTPLTSL